MGSVPVVVVWSGEGFEVATRRVRGVVRGEAVERGSRAGRGERTGGESQRRVAKKRNREAYMDGQEKRRQSNVGANNGMGKRGRGKKVAGWVGLVDGGRRDECGAWVGGGGRRSSSEW